MTMTRADYKTRFTPEGDKALSRKVVGVKLPIEIEQAIKSLPVTERGKWLRRVVTEAAKRELINPNQSCG